MDLNADLGESWYLQEVGNDASLMPLLDSCNIACGFHGGDALTMQRTISLALLHEVRIGAHPSFPDRKNFGRKLMLLPDNQLEALLLYQVSALMGMTKAAGGKVHHLKPHGALYHHANETDSVARSVAKVTRILGIPTLFGPPSGALEKAAISEGLDFWPEGFADRRYDNSLHLRPRHKENALIAEPAAAAEQVRLMIKGQLILASNGDYYPLVVKTICIHGDHDGALSRARAVREVLDSLKEKE